MAPRRCGGIFAESLQLYNLKKTHESSFKAKVAPSFDAITELKCSTIEQNLERLN